MEWVLGLGSWIVQDGNYGDFRVGQRIEVAVEFGFEAPPTLSLGAPGVTHVDGNTYDLLGRVVLVAPDVWVIDVGILAFNEAPPPRGLSVGDVVSGRAGLGVDPFFYFERLYKRLEMPSLIYSWSVRQIQVSTAPFIEQNRVLVRDVAKLGWKNVAETRAWADDGGNADYLVHCELLEVPPKRTTVSAT